ncbi:MAG: PilZ domain-containing protein [Nitrospirota bacterium]
MRLLHWLKFLKAPLPEKAVRRPSGPGSEKIYRPLPNNPPRRIARAQKNQTKETDAGRHSVKEKRRYKRFSLEGREVMAKMVLSEEIEIANMSIGGACIVTKNTFTPGAKVFLNLADGNIDGHLQCKVIWESAYSDDASAQSPGRCRAGVQFQAVPPYTLIRLKDFMREAGVPDMQKLSEQYLPSSLRFKIYRNRKASLKYPSPCVVKQLSLGGMLVDTHQEHAVEQKYPVALYLSAGDVPITCTGRIASQIPVRTERSVRYDTGIEFLNLADQDRSHLRRFLGQI